MKKIGLVDTEEITNIRPQFCEFALQNTVFMFTVLFFLLENNTLG